MEIVDIFFAGFDGKPLDLDGYPKEQPFQCVDVFHQYNKAVLQLGYVTAYPTGGARDYFENFDGLVLSSHYVRIVNDPNDPNQLPQKGDVIIWGPAVGQYGHVAIFQKVSRPHHFISFDQNWGGRFCHFQEHTWAGVLGWLRPRKFIAQSSSTGGDDVPDKISKDTARILAHGVLARNGLAGRPTALDGSMDAELEAHHVGRDLTNAYIQGLFLSEEGRNWRDTEAENSITGINRRLTHLVEAQAELKQKDIKIAELDESIIALTLERNKLIEEAGQEAPPVSSQPDPDLPVAETPAEEVPVITPNDFKASYTPEVATYETTADGRIIDFDNHLEPQPLKAGTFVEAAGYFRFHGKKYIRTGRSVLDGVWYGIPENILKVVIPPVDDLEDSDIDDLLNNDDMFKDIQADIERSVPDKSIRERLVLAVARLQGFFITFASILSFWKKK